MSIDVLPPRIASGGADGDDYFRVGTGEAELYANGGGQEVGADTAPAVDGWKGYGVRVLGSDALAGALGVNTAVFVPNAGTNIIPDVMPVRHDQPRGLRPDIPERLGAMVRFNRSMN